MFELWAKERSTKKDYCLKRFDDERQFDYYLDQVDGDIYEWAMITIGHSQCIRYKEFKVKQYVKTK